MPTPNLKEGSAMKLSTVTAGSLTLILLLATLVMAGIEPSPFNDFIPETRKLYAINHQLINIGRRVDQKLVYPSENQTPSSHHNGAAKAILAIDKKLVKLDKRQTVVVTEVLTACDPMLSCPADDTQPVADALLGVKASADSIATNIRNFLDTLLDENIPKKVINALSQVQQTAQQITDSANLYYEMIAAPPTTTYCHGEFNRLIIESGEGTETYKIVFAILDPAPQPADGKRIGNTLTLNATIQGFDLSYAFIFRDNYQQIDGQILIEKDSQSYIWNEWGVVGTCPTVDIESNGVPQFINSDFVDLNQIENISLFRSAAGHDYSDGFETCRSMKHYFSPPLAERINDTVSIFSPVAGRIVHLDTEEENFIDDGVTNQKVIIQPYDQPALLIILFHVDLLDPTIVVGTHLSAGQHIGFGRLIRNGSQLPSHDFDIALNANTHDGIRYISYFDAMTDSLFNDYAVWGSKLSLWDSFTISEAERDADPLTCIDETFTSNGSLPSWYYDLP